MPIAGLDGQTADVIYYILRTRNANVRFIVLDNLINQTIAQEVLLHFTREEQDAIDTARDEYGKRRNPMQQVEIDHLGQNLFVIYQHEQQQATLKAYEEYRKPLTALIHQKIEEKEKKDEEVGRLTASASSVELYNSLTKTRQVIYKRYQDTLNRANILQGQGRTAEANLLFREADMYKRHYDEYKFSIVQLNDPDAPGHGVQARLFIRAQREALKKAAEESERLRLQINNIERERTEEEQYQEAKRVHGARLTGRALGLLRHGRGAEIFEPGGIAHAGAGKTSDRLKKMFAGEEGFSSWSKYTMGKMGAISKAIVGLVVTLFLGGGFNWWFAFLSWAMVDFFPKEVSVPKNLNVTVRLRDFGNWDTFSRKFGHANGGSAFMRSALKITSILFFYSAISGSGIPFANLLLVALAFIAYQSLAVTYDPKNPGQLIESSLRFAFLGFFIIPFGIYMGIFHSTLLALIAIAFYAVPPIPKEEEGAPSKATTEGFFSLYKFIFIALMVFIAIGAFGGGGESGWGGWGLSLTNNPLGSLFLYFYIMAGVAGMFSPPENLPTVGGLFLGAATIIFAMGAGTQVVGPALLGQWFPTIYTGVSDVVKPFTDALYGFQGTLSTGFQLITNPVGFATGIINGTYARDPDTGVAGALGVEIENFRTTQLFANQPYVISYNLNNKGSAEAGGVKAAVTLGGKTFISKNTENLVPRDLGLKADPQPAGQLLSGQELLDGQTVLKERKTVYRLVGTLQMDKSAIEQIQFLSTDTGVTCTSVVTKDLKEKFIPLMAVAEYEYMVESQLEIDFISKSEWDRLAREGRLPGLSKKAAQITNAPVKLNIDTLEQPIKAGTDFFVAFNLRNERGPKGELLEQKTLAITYPQEFGDATCNSGTIKNKPSTNTIMLKKEGYTTTAMSGAILSAYETVKAVPGAVICKFTKAPELVTSVTVPKKTFFITASSFFTYQITDTRDIKLEFGGFRCCKTATDKKYGCIQGEGGTLETCEGNVCGGAAVPLVASVPGAAKYCEELQTKSGAAGAVCLLGGGGCTDNNQCAQAGDIQTSTGTISGPVVCRQVGYTNGLQVCCHEGATVQQCQAAHTAWVQTFGLTFQGKTITQGEREELIKASLRDSQFPPRSPSPSPPSP